MKQTGMLVVSLRGVKFGILVSLRVFHAQHQYIKLPIRSTELREKKQKL